MTADWEQKLLLIERGQYDADAFMKEINDMISSLISSYEAVKDAEVLMSDKKVIGRCPPLRSGSDRTPEKLVLQQPGL